MLKWWWFSLRPWRGGLLLSLLLLLTQVLLTLLLIPLATQLEPLLHQLELRHFWTLLATILGLYWGRQGVDYLQQILLGYLSNRWMLAQRQQSFKQLLRADWQHLRQKTPEESLTILSDDLDKLQQALWSSLYHLLPGVLTLTALMLALFWISWPLTLALLLLLPLAALLLRHTGRYLSHQAGEQQQALSLIIQALNESLQHLSLIRLYRLESHRQQALEQKQEEWFHHRWHTLLWQYLERPLLASLQSLFIAALLALSSWLVVAQHLSGADLLAFATALALAVDPGLWTAEALARLRVSRISWQRLQALQQIPPANPPQFGLSTQNKVEAHQVCRRYGPHLILDHLNLELSPGDKIGLSGPSGSGKSTLLKILAGLEAPDSGQLALPAGWQAQDILLIPQRAPLFQASLRENICLELKPSAESLQTVLEICHLQTLLARLPEGLDSVAGTRGSWLSGGEQQRLALARALLRQPRLLLLDEASAELDTDTEASILKCLKAAYPEMALLMVSHRHESLQQMEGLWHLEGGQLEQGKATHMSIDWNNLEAGLQDPDPQIRRQNLETLSQTEVAAAIPLLLNVSQRDPDPELRQWAATLCRERAEQIQHPRDPFGQFRI